jgi:transposase
MARRAYRRFSKEFKLEAIRLVEESGKPKAQVARELGEAQSPIYLNADSLSTIGKSNTLY